MIITKLKKKIYLDKSLKLKNDQIILIKRSL